MDEDHLGNKWMKIKASHFLDYFYIICSYGFIKFNTFLFGVNPRPKLGPIRWELGFLNNSHVGVSVQVKMKEKLRQPTLMDIFTLFIPMDIYEI